MRPIDSGWKQGEVQCFNSRSTIPRSVVFRNVVCIYSIRFQFQAVLEHVCPPGLRSLNSPFAFSYFPQ